MALSPQEFEDLKLRLKARKEKTGFTFSTIEDTPGFFDRVGEDLKKRGSAIKQTFQDTASGKINPLDTGIQVVGQAAGGINDVIGEGVSSAFNALPDSVQEGAKGIGVKILETPLGKAGLKAIQEGMESYEAWKVKNPVGAKNLESIVNIAALFPVGKATQAVKKGVTGVVDAGVDASKSAFNKGKNAILDPIKKRFALKAEEEILSTPVEKVHLLKPQERAVWFDSQSSNITKARETVDLKIRQELESAVAKSEQEVTKLQKQLSTASRDKVLELRPKIIKSLGEQSKTYRKLVSEELAGKEDLPINNEELKNFVDSRFGEDIGRAQAIKSKLGLTETVDPLSQKPTKLEAETTIGDLFDRSKALKQDIKNSVTKVFSPDDKLTDDAVHTLTDFLKDQGVDFSEANKFWARYAPIRDQLVKEAKPFVQAGTQTKTFAQTLERVAKGSDVNNENFIAEVEDLLQENLTKDAQKIIAKMDEAKKLKLVAEIKAQTALAENRLASESAFQKLASSKYEAERKGRFRSGVKTAIKLLVPGAIVGSFIDSQ